jgi:hypothetical protein
MFLISPLLSYEKEKELCSDLERRKKKHGNCGINERNTSHSENGKKKFI